MHYLALHLPGRGNSGLSERTITHKHKHLHAHILHTWQMGPWGLSSRQKDPRDPPGDKAERNDEDNVEEERGLFHAHAYTVYLQVSC